MKSGRFKFSQVLGEVGLIPTAEQAPEESMSYVAIGSRPQPNLLRRLTFDHPGVPVFVPVWGRPGSFGAGFQGRGRVASRG
jgi:hypothetical protein